MDWHQPISTKDNGHQSPWLGILKLNKKEFENIYNKIIRIARMSIYQCTKMFVKSFIDAKNTTRWMIWTHIKYEPNEHF